MIGGGQLTMKSRFDRGNKILEIMIDPRVAEPQILKFISTLILISINLVVVISLSDDRESFLFVF